MESTESFNFTRLIQENYYNGPPPLTIIHWFQIFIFAVVCIVGLVGNTLVIYVVVRFSKMQTVTNMYIVNLAIADECFLVGIPFLLVTMINRGWIFGKIACKAYMISTSINQFTSSLLLSIMSGDRYIAVCHPISSPRWRTPVISGAVSVLAWTCSILLMLPIIQYATIFQHNNTAYSSASCVIKWEPDENNFSFSTSNSSFSANSTMSEEPEGPEGGALFIIYTFVFSFAIPLCMTMVFYFLVIRKLKTVGPKNKSKEKKRSHRKVTNLVLTVVTVYVCCWLPYWMMQLGSLNSNHTDNESFFVTLHLLFGSLSYANSAMNPILYAFLSDNFKKSFLKACTCAANRDVNATLHLENSVFPRKNKQGSARFRATSIIPNNDDENDQGPLVSKADASTSAITMTSRSNLTSVGDNRDTVKCRNGTTTSLIVPPTTL